MSLRIATFNLQNLDDRVSDARLARLSNIMVGTLEGPQILALQEVGAEAGTRHSHSAPPCRALDRLCLRVAQDGGPQYVALQVSPRVGHDGGQAGTDIRPVILFDPAAIEFQARGLAGPDDANHIVNENQRPRLSLNPGRIEPIDPAFEGDPQKHWRPSRKALAAEFSHQGRQLLFVVCHLTSMRAVNRRLAEHGRRQRHAQARIIADFVAKYRRINADAWTIVLGDFNDTPGTKTLDLMRAGELVNPITQLPKRTRYTRRHGGRPQALDHILIPPQLADQATLTIPHVNTDADPAHRSSDHDPVLLTLTL